jgi:lincosamide nucleotidyltransferase A/C/D/E
MTLAESEPGADPETGAPEVLAVLDALRSAGCRVWVSGGWGVDVLFGRQTRKHRDLDLAIEQTGLTPGLTALATLGYLVETDWLPVRIEVHRAGRGRVDLHPIAFDQQGDGVQAGFEGQNFRYPNRSFVHGTLNGRVVGCISAELQLTFRQGYELREVDRHDLALLHSLPDSSSDSSPVRGVPGGDVSLSPSEEE